MKLVVTIKNEEGEILGEQVYTINEKPKADCRDCPFQIMNVCQLDKCVMEKGK